ncbi:MAG: hypothetical protein ABIP14_08085 [Blastocatellia bacterium]
MKKPLIVSLLCLLLSSSLAAQTSSTVAESIRVEALRTNDSSNRPLPLVGHWNMGVMKDGFNPEYQMRMLEHGHHLLPWFQFPEVNISPEDPRWMSYYEAAIKRAAQLRLPISLVGTQWESVLTSAGEYFNLPPERNPNVVTANGAVKREVSPFGPVDVWREAGTKWTASQMMKKLQEWYPDPPLILLVSNHEHSKLEWKRAEEDYRFVKAFGKGRDDDFKRKATGDGWIARYHALQQGMRDGLSNRKWRENARFIAYDAFGPSHFARWPGWMEHSLYTAGRIDPWPLAWDGGSPSFYLFNWSGITDYAVFSPQVEAMNWLFMLQEAQRANPQFWFELSIWDGHEPAQANDKRKYYERIGQPFTPERYGGMAQFGMWLLRPRVVREFRGYQDTVAQMEPYFLPVVEAVDRVYSNATLREFWRKGELVANRARQHPYQTRVPPEYQRVDRWFLLDTSLDPPRPWELGTQLPVFALALVKGAAGQRQWLIYAHAPAGARKDVQITIPGFRAVPVNVTVSGSFYLADEKTRRVQAVN